MKKSSNLFVSIASSQTPYLAVVLLTLTQLVPLANAYPGNQKRYDCYRKSNNQFNFGSPTDVSNRMTLCTPNPNYQNENGYSNPRNTPVTQNQPTQIYNNIYPNRDYYNAGASFVIGLGNFVFGAFVGSALWSWGWGWGSWGDWAWQGGDVYIDASDINVDIGNIGDLDASIQDIDLTEIDASGDEIGIDESDDNFQTLDGEDSDLDEIDNELDVDPGTEDMNDGDFGDDLDGDDFGGDDFGDDFGDDDFGGDDFGGDDFGDFDDF